MATLLDPNGRLRGLLGQSPSTTPVTPRSQPPAPPEQQNKLQQVLGLLGRGGSAVANALGTVTAGPNDPNLSDADNQRARQMALLQGGLATLASGPGSTGLQSFAQGALHGQGVAAQHRDLAYARTATERLQNFINSPEFRLRATPEQAAWISSLSPDKAEDEIGKIMMAPDPGPEFKVVGNSLVQINPDGSTATAFEDLQNAPTEVIARLRAQGVDESAASPDQWAQAMREYDASRASTAARTTVNVGAEDKGRQALAESGIDFYNKIQDRGDQAAQSQPNLDLMGTLLESGVPSGGWQSLSEPIRNFLSDLGFSDGENVTRQQLLRSLSFSFVPNIRQAMGNMGQLSDKDLQFLISQVPDIGNTEEANKLIAEVLRRKNEWVLREAAEADRFLLERPGDAHLMRAHIRGWTKDIFEQEGGPFADLIQRYAPSATIEFRN